MDILSVKKRAHRSFLRNQAFTLVEVVLVIAILSVINLAVYSAFSMGLKVWQRGQHLVLEEDIAVFLDRFEQELHNSFKYSLISFEGREHRISFPSVVHTVADPKVSPGKVAYINQIGRIEYYFDPQEGTLFRKDANYGLAVDGKFFRAGPVLQSIKDVQFKYELIDAKDNVTRTSSADELPAVVDVQVFFLDDLGNFRKIQRIINVPAGLGS